MAKKMNRNFTTPVGTAKYPHLNSPDKAFDDVGKYKTELLMSPKDAAPLLQHIKEVAENEFAKADYRSPFTKDEETGQVSFKVQTKKQPDFVDASGQVVPETHLPRIGGGSQLALQGFLTAYVVSGSKGVSMTLEAVQIVEAKSMGGSAAFGVVDGGYSVGLGASEASLAAIVDDSGGGDYGDKAPFDF